MPNAAHANAEKRGWRVTDSAIRFENKVMRLRDDSIALPEKGDTKYAYVERGPAVIIVPVTERGEMVLIRQFRYPVDAECLEVPAGTTRDVPGMRLEEVAAKELKEEVGATFTKLERITSFFSNGAMSDEECHVFIAFGVALDTKPDREPAEEMKTFLLPVAEAVERARRGEMKSAPTALAVLVAEPRLRECGYL